MKTQNKIITSTVLEKVQQQLAESYRLYKLSESTRIIKESTLSKLIGSAPSGQALVRWMHARHQLSNTADYETHPMSERIMFEQFKYDPDNFIIISAARGVAGIRPNPADFERGRQRAASQGKEYNPAKDNSMRYQVIAFKDGVKIDPDLLRSPKDVERERDPTVMKARGGIPGKRDPRAPNIFELLKEQIGKLQTIYISKSRVSGVGKRDVKSFVKGYEPNQQQGQTSGGVERDKLSARAVHQKSHKPDDESIIDHIADRLFNLAPSVIAVIPRRLRKAGIDPNQSRRLAAVNQNINDESFKSIWRDSVGNSLERLAQKITDPDVQQAIKDFRNANPKYNGSDSNVLWRIAAQGNTAIASAILTDLKDNLAAWFIKNKLDY